MDQRYCKPSAILNKLEKLLHSVEANQPGLHCSSDTHCGTSSENDAIYALQYDQIQATTTNLDKKILDSITEEVKKLFLTQERPSTLRVCSIGCGDGSFDGLVLSNISRACPNVKIEYVGIDVNKLFCDKARKTLSLQKNVDISIYHQGFMEEFQENGFDLVIAVHSFYYFTSPDLALNKMMSSLKKNGLALVVLSQRNPTNELYGLFWEFKHKKESVFSDRMLEILEKHHIQHNVKEVLHSIMDMTSSFKNKFHGTKDKHLLNFLVYSDLKLFPETIQQTCIDYFHSVATGLPEKFLLHVFTCFICIHK